MVATRGVYHKIMIHDPLMQPKEAEYGLIYGDTAVIEMAAASGLPMVPVAQRNPLHTSTYGTGELILDALNRGIRKISIAIGGSATNDGGIGAMRALGVRFLDENQRELSGVGSDLIRITDIDASGLHPAIKEAEITVMCDVTNPLTGIDGATYTFGAQKGGTPEILNELELGMKNYAAIIRNKLGIDVEHMSGAGAAGGLGAALCVFLNAELKSGIETVLNLINFDQLLDGTDLVITGEGRIDWQSAYGKVPSGIGLRCKKRGIPVIAIVGGMGDQAEKIYEFGVDSILPTVNGAMSIEEACDRAEILYANAAERAFRFLKVGMNL